MNVFTHSAEMHKDARIVKMTSELGWESYAIYWVIVETIAESDNKKIRFDPKKIRQKIKTSTQKINKIVRNYGLFEIFDGEYITTSDLITEKVKRDLISQKRRQSVEKRWTKNTPKNDEKSRLERVVKQDRSIYRVNEITTQIDAKSSVKQDIMSGQIIVDDGQTILPDEEQIIAEWNRIFAGTRQTYNGFYLAESIKQDLLRTLEQYSLDDVYTAFMVARLDRDKPARKRWLWFLKDVTKIDNIQRLLAREDELNGTSANGVKTGNFANYNGHIWTDEDFQWGRPADECLQDMRRRGVDVSRWTGQK